MPLKGFMRKFKPLKILTEEQVEAIHRGSLYVLETTGIRVEHHRALGLFADHGCNVDFDNKRVRIPGWLVEESLRKCPSSFLVRARDPRNDLMVGGNTLYFAQEPAKSLVDLSTWEPRTATLKDHADAIRVLDALDNVHCLQPYSLYSDIKEIPPVMVMLEGLASGIRNSAKAQMMGYSSDCEIFAIKMAKAIGIDLIGGMMPSSPLTLYIPECAAAFRYAEAGFPLFIVSGALMGGTAPATFAGATITNNAEILAGVTLVQLIKPGSKVIVYDFVFPMNMRNGSPDFGALGFSLHNAVFNQIWGNYKIPIGGTGFCHSSSKKIDFQNAYERAMYILSSAISGSNLPCLHGPVHGQLTYHPVQAVLDDDIAGWVGRFLEGVEVNYETLAIDLINEVGPIPGQYLSTKHTRKWWQKEQFVPKVADRLTYPEWMQCGKKDALTLAKDRVRSILATHTPIPLTSDQEKGIELILKEARKYYRKKGLIPAEKRENV